MISEDNSKNKNESRSKSKMEWIDISIPIKNGMVNWPDDPPVKIERVSDLKDGDNCNLSKISMGSHTGTHIDTPLHFIKDGKSLNDLPFDAIIGPARVIEIFDKKTIKIEELERHHIRRGERILFKTKNSERCWNHNIFIKDYVYLSKDAAEFLVTRGIKTVGVDYLSIGKFDQDGDKTHYALLKAGIWIIEGLNLSNVRQGKYQLLCLPIMIENSDGAPARVIIKIME